MDGPTAGPCSNPSAPALKTTWERASPLPWVHIEAPCGSTEAEPPARSLIRSGVQFLKLTADHAPG